MGAEGGLVSNLDELLEGGTLAKYLREGDIGDALMKLIRQSERAVLNPRADGCSLLHRFALLGCYDAVKLLWENGARPSVLRSDDSTLLHSAVRATDHAQDQQRADILTLFLDGGAGRAAALSVNHRNAKGWTALKLAARKGLERCVETLLNHGADPNIADSENYLPLHNAIGNHAILKLLVSHPHNIDSQTQNGESSLYIAVESGHVDCVVTLLEHRADPNIANKEGITPLFLAARGGNVDMVRVLLRHHAHVNVTGAAQRIGPLHWAAHKEFTDIALLLIEYGADIQLRDKEGRTPLGLASPELASKMLEVAKRRNPSAVMSPLHSEPVITAEEKAISACCSGNVQALQSLLQAGGLNVNQTNDGTNATLLHMGAYCGQMSIVALLLSNGADWKLTDKDGDTVLHFACMKEVPQGNHEATLQFLLASAAGCLIDSQNLRGDTPLLVAIRCEFFQRAKVLLQHNANSTIRNLKNELPVHRAACGDIGIVLQLTEVLTDLDIQDKDGWTPLMYAARSKSASVVHYLLQRGVDPNLQQSVGFTALHLAAQENEPYICQLLLRYRANPNISGGPQSLTPLHIAAHKLFKEVCWILVENGANCTLQDKDGDTPLTLTDDQTIIQTIESAHESYTARMRERNNTQPITPPPCGFRSLFKRDSKEGKQLDEVCCLEDEIAKKESVLEKLICKLKTLESEKEYLGSRLRACEEDLKQHELSKMAELSLEENGEVTTKPWWLIGEHEIVVSEEQLNTTSGSFQRYFDVYKGSYRTMDVAVKKINRNKNWETCAKNTFLREVEQLSRLHSPFIVQFIGALVVESEGLYSLILEYMPLGDLHSLMHVQKKQLAKIEKIRIARDIATGMAYLHSFPIIHRNLIPRNVLIGESLNAKVSDFGVYETKVQTNFYSDIRKNVCSSEKGCKPIYFAPEVIEKQLFSTASDIYSFGMILQELVTEKKPYSDMEPCQNRMVWVMKVLMGARPKIPEDLEQSCQDIIAQCWHQDPSLRPTFKEFLVHCKAKDEEEKNQLAQEEAEAKQQ